MRYAHNTKPPKVEAAASTDQSRPVLAAVYLDAERAELQVTDSYIAARVPVEVGADEVSGFITPEAVKLSRKRDAGGIRVNGSVQVMPYGWDGDAEVEPLVTFPREDRGQVPNYEQLWPVNPPVFRVGLNAGFLKRLADALGAEDGAVEIAFPAFAGPDGTLSTEPNPLRPMVVRPLKGATEREHIPGAVDRAEGLIMPVRLP